MWQTENPSLVYDSIFGPHLAGVFAYLFLPEDVCCSTSPGAFDDPTTSREVATRLQFVG